MSSPRCASRSATASTVGASIRPASLPSARNTTESAYEAATGSCVTITTVRPCTRTASRNSSSTPCAARVQGAGRLVREDHPGLGDQRAGDGDPLALTAGELVGAVTEPVAETDRGEDLLGPRTVDAPPGELQRQHRVLRDGERVQQVVLLEHEPDPTPPEPRQLGLGPARHLRAVDHHDPAVRPVEPRRALQQRRLAGPRRTHHRRERPALQAQRDPVQRGHRAVVTAVGPAHLDQPQCLGGGSLVVSVVRCGTSLSPSVRHALCLVNDATENAGCAHWAQNPYPGCTQRHPRRRVLGGARDRAAIGGAASVASLPTHRNP